MPNSRTDCIILVRTVKFLIHQHLRRRMFFSAVLSLPSGLCLVYVTGCLIVYVTGCLIVYQRLPRSITQKHISISHDTPNHLLLYNSECVRVCVRACVGVLASQRSRISCGCIVRISLCIMDYSQYYTLQTSGESQ